MNTQDLIDSLVSEVKPVKTIKSRNGIAAVLVASGIAALSVIAYFGARSDILSGTPDPIVVVRGMLLLLLGLATSFAVTHAARPSVGKSHNGWAWALAAAMVLPVSATMLYGYHMMMARPFAKGEMDFGYGPYCLAISWVSALLIGTVQTLWLRRGAPTDLNRAGWLVGLTSGSFGTFAYSLHCPSNSIYYVGLFYALAVGLCAVIGGSSCPANQVVMAYSARFTKFALFFFSVTNARPPTDSIMPPRHHGARFQTALSVLPERNCECSMQNQSPALPLPPP